MTHCSGTPRPPASSPPAPCPPSSTGSSSTALSPPAGQSSRPGGPAILTAAQLGFDLTDVQLQHSRAGLAEVGNLGSASILDVLRRTHGTPPDNRGPGLMLAYGPGFTTTALTSTWTAWHNDHRRTAALPETHEAGRHREEPPPRGADPVAHRARTTGEPVAVNAQHTFCSSPTRSTCPWRRWSATSALTGKIHRVVAGGAGFTEIRFERCRGASTVAR
ncbi:hypothetical protein ACH4SK_43220 [Streptomyces inhibens]|uniref:hypothetical protein n=1 Tax=Streptomyces inhibens TaxID=2293571 RepID=UPI0037A3949F